MKVEPAFTKCPAKEPWLADSLQALLVCASQRSLAGAFSKIDCGFRNPSLLLGLAIWFSKTEPLVSSAT
ncbi:hypothetical protein, partial [Myxococcus sp. CA056]|uniref:hypothetical protein n=1 Tax=Myxococcus sp. CA056 TaxID=2741740 RepID=UPI001C2DD603